MAELSAQTPLVDIENRLCPGCKNSAVNESGGLVVAFGQSFFHVDCFKCAKCNNKVTADTNLLLLSDGSPICAECSYNCNICQQPILDEAIMTGDDSYHAHCFKCKVCHNRIDELVFAKTSHGIYCMNCHNERMAKIRRHAQRKREKERAANASASSRDRDLRDFLPEIPNNLTPPSSLRSKVSAPALRDAPSTQSLHISLREITSTPTRQPRSPSPVDRTPTPVNATLSTPTEPQREPQSFVITVAPPDINPLAELPVSNTRNSRSPTTTNGHPRGDASPSGVPLQSAPAKLTSSHLSPTSSTPGTGLSQRRKSFDDGMRPLNVILGKNGANQDKKDAVEKLPIGGLSVPAHTSRVDKRRSINPGLSLQYKDAVPSSAPPDMVRSQTPLARSDSPIAPSPPKTYSDDSTLQRGSDACLLRDISPGSTVFQTPSSSSAIPENGRATPECARTRSASYDPTASSALRPAAPSRSAPRPIVTLERPPQRSDSLHRANGANGVIGHNTNGHPGSTRPPRLDGSKSERSSPLGWNGDRIGMMTPTSPSHRADVPHGVESGTDTEAESSNGRKSDDDVAVSVNSPPRPPPKPRPEALKLNLDPDVSAIPQLDGSAESSPVERTSIATFIAPALPPIRFSMSGGDFSDFLKSVGGIPSLKSLDEIAQQEETPARSPTSINTLIPQDVTNVPPGNSNTSLDSVAPSSSPDDTEATDTVPNMPLLFLPRGRAASDSQASPSHGTPKRERRDSNASLNITPSTSQPSTTRITVTSPTADNSVPPPVAGETHDLVLRRLREALSDANARGLQQLRFEKVFVETILISLECKCREHAELNDKFDRSKRVSQQYIDGLTVAQKEYDRELVARRNAESEIIRLRVLLSGQAAKLTALTGETSRREARRQLSEELTQNLDRLEKDLSKLKAEREVTLAEVEELCSSKSAPGIVSSGEVSAAQLSRSLTMRLDNIKNQYQHELVPLTQQRDTLLREITELKSAREQFLEETTVLNVRNEELAQLSAQYTRRMDAAQSDAPPAADVPPVKPELILRENKSTSFDRGRPTLELPPPVQPSLSTGPSPSTSTLVEDRDIKVIRVPKPEFTDSMSTSKHGIFKWPGYRMRDQTLAAGDSKGKGNFEHNFQPASALRFTRCDHCAEKLWGGPHFRCTTCHMNVHSRCVHQVHLACTQHRLREDMNGIGQPPRSIFGRTLADQVKYDMRWGDRKVPVIVEKCIEAVETLALDFEGIYRKTGGSGQTKMITQLFDRGDYTAFDLKDIDRFNDICAVTSVLKTYFRSLPVPLLTFDLHEEFIVAAGIKDSALKTKQLQDLVDRLPPEHYHTLRLLVLHLHRVREHSDENLMNARNLGVVFGPTLMWSRDPGSEFSDMAGKALMIEWLVENAPTIFQS